MSVSAHFNDSIHWNVAEVTARIVAESGIPSDRFHMGKIILQSLKDYPDKVLQIDAGTGQFETNAEAMRRTIKCALSFKAMGLQKGDLMVLMAPMHLDLAIPFYAALYLGIVIAPIDMNLGVAELIDIFNVAKPKILYCQSGRVLDVIMALGKSDCNAQIVTFDKSDHSYFGDLLDKYCDEETIKKFRPTDFDPAETLATVISTSGTTGPPKLAEITHKNFAIAGPYHWCRSWEFPPYNTVIVLAPLQWLSAVTMLICGPYVQFTRVQSSKPITRDHIYYMINTYKVGPEISLETLSFKSERSGAGTLLLGGCITGKDLVLPLDYYLDSAIFLPLQDDPQYSLMSPTLMTTLLKSGDLDACDFTCFKTILLAGSAVHKNLINEIKNVYPDIDAVNTYGMTEIAGFAFIHGHSSPPHSCGKPSGCLQYKLVDVTTGNEIFDPHVKGELYLKGPGVFKGYYNKPEVSQEVFDDGWFKTGDIFYRDEAWNFFFVERLKLLLKYKSHQISPMEIESVIMQHPSVLDVVVTGIPDQEYGDLAVACVVPKPGFAPTAQEIKDLVKKSLSDTKQLRGGVVFMKQLPTTASTKVHRMKIREMVLNMPREE